MSTLVMDSSNQQKVSKFKGWVVRRPLTAFFTLAFSFGWLAFLPVILSKAGFGLLPYDLPLTDYPGRLSIPFSALLGPVLATFVITAITGGKQGLKELGSRSTRWRIGPGWYGLVLVGLPLLTFLLSGLVLGGSSFTTLAGQVPLILPAFVVELITTLVIVQIAEEIGWMGFALPTLQARYGPMKGTIFLSLAFALFHLPIIFVIGGTSDTSRIEPTLINFVTVVPLYLLLLIMFAIPVRLVTTWLYNRTKGSIVIVMVLHATMNALNTTLPRLHPDLNSTATILGLAGAALLIVILTKARLAYPAEPKAKPVQTQ